MSAGIPGLSTKNLVIGAAVLIAVIVVGRDVLTGREIDPLVLALLGSPLAAFVKTGDDESNGPDDTQV